jgi:Mor family transcriptional regulator
MSDRDDDTTDMFGIELSDAEAMAHLDEMTAVEFSHWPQRLVELIDVISECLVRKHQVSDDAALRQASDLTVAISRYFGGRQIYIPLSQKLERAIRDKIIYQECKSGNIEELAIKYKMTTVSIYKIYSRQRALHISRIQRPLF